MTDLLARSLLVIPGGAQTFSKMRGCWPELAPTHLVRGLGARVWDQDGNEYIDLACALGAVTLGYRDPIVENSVSRQLSAGPLFSLPHPLETEVAEALTQIIPCAKGGQVRFVQTGTEATAAAIRVARHYTGRTPILSAGYHGWADWCCPNPAGIPSNVRSDTEIVGSWPRPAGWPIDVEGGRFAALIVEPEAFTDDELPSMRDWCDRGGAILIFDEVLTGFRVGHGGYQQFCGVTPDLATFSKAMGNGYPVAAIVGRRDVMRTFEDVGVSGTFGGNAIGLAAAMGVIEKTEHSDYYDHLQRVGASIRQGFLTAAQEADIEVITLGLDTHWIPAFFGDDSDVDPIIRSKKPGLPRRTLYRQEMARRGVLIGPSYVFAPFAIGLMELDRIATANRAALRAVASAEQLIGAPARPGIRAA